jgi:hypothetical protein
LAFDPNKINESLKDMPLSVSTFRVGNITLNTFDEGSVKLKVLLNTVEGINIL